jgi:tetratricopeptide (TPR) repeat protein
MIRSFMVLAFVLAVTATAGPAPGQDVDLVKARKWLESQRYSDVIGMLEPARKGGSRDPVLLRLLGRAYVRIKRPSSGVGCFRDVIASGKAEAGDHALLAWALFEQAGVELGGAGGLARAAYLDAADAARAALKIEAKNLMAWEFLTASLERAREDEQARRAYDSGIETLGVRGRDLRLAYASYLSRNGDADKALAILEPVRSDGDAEVELARARIRADSGRLDKALEILRSILAKSPDHQATYEELWRRVNPPEQRRRGVKILEEVVAGHPGSLLAWSYLGNLYRVAKDFRSAERAYRKCLEINPGYAWAHQVLGELYQQEALAALKKKPVDPDEVKDRFGRAIDAYLDYLDRVFATGGKPDRNAINGITLLFVDLARRGEDPEGAYRRLPRLLARLGDDALVQHTRGLVCEDLGKFDESEAAFKRAIALAPPEDEFTLAQFIVNLGLLYEGWNKYADAKKQYEIAAKMTGKGKLDALENLGKIAYKLGNPRKAIGYFKAVLEEDSSRAPTLFYYHLCRRWIQRETYYRKR